jgi:hypothetical protein
MQTGKYIFSFPEINKEKFENNSSGINYHSLKQLIEYLRVKTEDRKTALIIFVHPDLKKLSEQMHVSSKDIYLSFIYLSSHFPEMFKFESYFQLDVDGLFEQIHEEDKDLLQLKNIYRNPYNPDIFYKEADQHIRFVFNIGRKI